MPIVTKQRVVSSNGAVMKSRTSKGTLLSRAIDVSEITEDYLKVTIYGGNRTGKSSLACCFPKPLLLLDFEPARSCGAKSVRRYDGVKYLKIASTEDALAVARELRDEGGYVTVVIDSATAVQDVALKELMDLPDVPSMLSWGLVSEDQYRQRSEKTREVLRPFLDLACHTVVLCKEKDHNPNKGDRSQSKARQSFQQESFYASDLGGATVGWLHDSCGYICRLYVDKEVKTVTRKVKLPGNKYKEKQEEVETGRTIRRLRTMLHPNFAAGMRTERPEDVPEWIDADTPDEMYRIFMRIVNGEKE